MELEQQLEVATNDSLKVEALISLGEYQLRRDFNRARIYHDQISQIIDSATSYDSRAQMGQMLQQKGVYNRKRANYTAALQHYLDATKIFIVLEDSASLATSYHNIATVHEFQKDRQRAIHNFKKAIAINKRMGSPKSLGSNYNGIADNFGYMGQQDSVHYYFDLAEKQYEIAGYEEGIYLVISNRANEFVRLKKYEEALPLQTKNLEYLKKTNNKEATATAHFNLSIIFSRLGQYEKSLHHANEVITIAKKEKLGRRLALSYRRRSRVYNYLEDYKKALDDYRLYKKTYDSIYNVQKAKEIREIELNNRFQQQKIKDSLRFVQEKELATAALQQKNERRTLWMTIIFLVILAMAIIGYLLYRQRALRAEREAQEKRIKNLELARQVAVKTKQVDTLITETVSHINKKQRLTKEIQEALSSDDQNLLKGILAELKADKIEDSKSKMFKEQLGHINLEFVQKLKNEFPELTKTELDVASYIQLGMSRNDIANLRNTTTESVKKTRSRIRKKLSLDQKEPLYNFLVNF